MFIFEPINLFFPLQRLKTHLLMQLKYYLKLRSFFGQKNKAGEIKIDN